MTIDNTNEDTKMRRTRRKPTAEEQERDQLIDNLLKDYRSPEEVIGEGGLLQQLTKRLLERTLGAELTDHVGYEKSDAVGRRGEQHKCAANC